MERSRLPLPSLLSLFGALLMLSPELLLGIPEDSANFPFTKREVGKALAFAMEQYNRDRGDSPNYFKPVRVMLWQRQVGTLLNFSFLAQLVKTTCEKIASWKPTSLYIHDCEQLQGNQEKPICFFKVTKVLSKMELAVTSCI